MKLNVSTLAFLPFSRSETIQLSHKPAEDGWPFLLHAQFTPRGHSLIIVYNYDIYFMSGPRSQQAYRITKSAVPGHIYNGVPDWLYEGKSASCPQVHLSWRREFGDRVSVAAAFLRHKSFLLTWPRTLLIHFYRMCRASWSQFSGQCVYGLLSIFEIRSGATRKTLTNPFWH